MSYTPPTLPLNVTWEGTDAYSAPTLPLDVSWQPSGPATVSGTASIAPHNPALAALGEVVPPSSFVGLVSMAAHQPVMSVLGSDLIVGVARPAARLPQLSALGRLAPPPLVFSWFGLSEYVAPSATEVDLSWYVPGQGSPMGAPSIEASVEIVSVVALQSMLGLPSFVAAQPITAWIATSGIMSAPTVSAFTDWTTTIGDSVRTSYECEITGMPPVRVPVSSWQATIQTGRMSYVQSVVPAAGPYIDTLNARQGEEFVIYKIAKYSDGSTIEQEMARAPLEQISAQQGPMRQTATLSGYSNFVQDEVGPESRNLTGIRSVSQNGSTFRVRSDIDWLLRPGMTAHAAGRALNVAYINYYVSGNQAYMDVGERVV